MRSTGVRFLDRIRMRWRSLFHRQELEQELLEELRFHYAALIEQYRQSGLDPREASRRARLELGGPAQISEEARDQRGWHRLDQVLIDTKYAFRSFRKHAGFVLTAVLTIGLGMGVNTSLFSVMHAVMFRPLPVAEPATLRNVYLRTTGIDRASYGSSSFVSFREFGQIRSLSTTGDIAGIAEASLSWRGLAGRSLRAQLVSDNLLGLIGARPALGRFFTKDETSVPGSAPVVVLSHATWQRDLGGAMDVVGRSITLNRTPFTIIGVADPRARGPLIQAADVWIPITMQRLTRPGESLVDDPGAAWIQLFARTRSGHDDRDLTAEMQVLGPQAVLAQDTVGRVEVSVVPAAFANFPDLQGQVFPALGLIWVAFALILIVACANVANMLLARGLSRQREIAVRLAIGAGRGRLVGQLLTESAWLGILGGVAGLLLATGLGQAARVLTPAHLGLQLDLSPDRSILVFAAAISILSGLAFGLLPALQATRTDLTPGMRAEGMLVAGQPRARLQHTLIALQVAGCVVLLVNAGLVVRSMTRALDAGVGKPLDHLLTGSFDLRQQQYTAARGEEFFRRLQEELGGQAGVVAAGPSILEPEIGAADNRIEVGDSGSAGGERLHVSFDEVGAGYFAAAGLRTLAGRTFTDQEVRAGLPVAVIDQRLADRSFGGQAVGKRLWLSGGGWQGERRPFEIVGVVNSTVPLGMGRVPMPTYYVPIRGLRYLEATMWVRYRGTAAPVTAAIRKAAEAVDPEVSVTVRTIEENVATATLPIRILSWSLGALGVLALGLASIGLFGVIAFSVGRRAREIAVRMALGAAPVRIIALICRQGLRPVVWGVGLGLVLAIGAGFLVRAMLFGLSPFDPIAIGLVLVAVAVASGLAFLIPARRAIAVEPASVLRVD